VSHQIDAAVNLVESPALQPKFDLASRNACSKELPPRDNPVLLRRESRNEAVRTSREGFATHNVVNPALDRDAPPRRQALTRSASSREG
jgi:hypothetical protein